MPDGRLVTPDEIEDLLVAVVRDRHAEHLAKYERLTERSRGTIERFRTVSHLAADDDRARLSSDELPAVLIGVLGTAGPPVLNDRDALDIPLNVGMQVTVLGQKRRDTLRRRDVMAWTAIECLLQRVPRSDLVNAIELVDYEPVHQPHEERILAEARVVLVVDVADMVAVTGGLPATDTQWPAGGPGGPPPDGEPYEPPLDLPPATALTLQIDRAPIVE